MTPGRLAILIVAKLIEEGFITGPTPMSPVPMNAPCRVAEEVIECREEYGDVYCLRDAYDLQHEMEMKGVTDGTRDQAGAG